LRLLQRRLAGPPAKRGKEPTYINNPQLPQSPPLTIPHHSRPLKIGTALNILDQLEKDIDDLEELLPKSIHMTLVHSRSDFCLFLCGDVLDRRGDRRLRVEVGQLRLPGAVQVHMVYHIGHQLW